MGVETQENYLTFDESMIELQNLTETAQGEVVGQLTQKLPVLNKRTIVGKGKLEELAALIQSRDAELVIFNHEVTARQAGLIEEIVGVKVIDRVQLILDIFALRATSKEGQLQVELAQLSYMLPRLTGQGTSLSRLGGGIGTRGPGETKLETDRRHIRNKMTQIKRELKLTEEHRERNREKRKNAEVFQIGLIGYTNAGKSTLMNQLTESDTYAMDQLFATLDPLTKKMALPEGLKMTLTDTVGFIQHLPTQLIEAFQSTLEESKGMDLLLHVVDASSTNRHQQEETVLELLKDLDMEKMPVLTVYNKIDLLDDEAFYPTLFPNILVSAQRTEDAEKVEKGIVSMIKEIYQPYTIILQAHESYLLNELMQKTLLRTWRFDEEKQNYVVEGFARPDSKWANY